MPYLNANNSSADYFPLIAAAADLCLKPWQYSVVDQTPDVDTTCGKESTKDLIVRIECRDQDGERHPENDLDVDISRSGSDISLILSWCNQHKRPILWHGQHSIWMDSDNGKLCSTPSEGDRLEALARRLKALFVTS